MLLLRRLLAWGLVSGAATAHLSSLSPARTTQREECPALLMSGKLSSQLTEPWSHQPLCKTWRPKSTTRATLPIQTHCLFSKKSFREDHGVSIITTSAAASDLLSFGALEESNTCGIYPSSPPRYFTPGPVAHPDTGVPAYEVKSLPGKGKGVIARRHIKKDEVFMLDYPAILAASDFAGAGWSKTQEKLIQSALDQLPKKTQKGVLSLATSDILPDHPLGDIFATNTCSLTLAGGVPHLGLFVEVSRMNHACVPNAFFRFLAQELVMEVFAFRDIKPGEEISINYAQLGMPYKVRQQYLETNYGFKCTCSLCKAPASERKPSDDRRMKLSELGQKVEAAQMEQDWEGAASFALQALEEVSLSEAEALTPLAYGYYEKLAKIHLEMKDIDMARFYADKAFEGFSHLRGVDSDRAQELKRFLSTLERQGSMSGQ